MTRAGARARVIAQLAGLHAFGVAVARMTYANAPSLDLKRGHPNMRQGRRHRLTVDRICIDMTSIWE